MSRRHILGRDLDPDRGLDLGRGLGLDPDRGRGLDRGLAE